MFDLKYYLIYSNTIVGLSSKQLNTLCLNKKFTGFIFVINFPAVNQFK